LSRGLQRLEHHLGTRLFDRSRQGVKPTTFGLRYLDHARALSESAARREADLADQLGRRESQLRVAIGLYPAELPVPFALGEIARRWPDLTVQAEIVGWHRALEMLHSGATQLVLCEREGHEKFANEPVSRLPVWLVVRPGHPLAGDRAPGFEETLRHPWACTPIPKRGPPELRRPGLRAGRYDEQAGYFLPAVSAPSLSTALSLVRSSDLVGFSPLCAVEPWLEQGDLVVVRYRAPWMRLNYGFAWRSEDLLPRVAREFMAQVHAQEARLWKREARLARRFAAGLEPRVTEAGSSAA
jgi:DNA-binding transcriptional LysR family regulator